MWRRCSSWCARSRPSAPASREAQAEIERLNLIIKKLQRSQFGRRAERLDDDQLQLGLEDLDADLARTEASASASPSQGQDAEDRKTSGRACRRTCPARTSGSMSSIRPAPAAAARCT